MSIVKIQIDTEFIKNIYNKIRNLFKSPIPTIKSYIGKRKLKWRNKFAKEWYLFLTDKYGEIPGALANVSFKRVSLNYYEIWNGGFKIGDLFLFLGLKEFHIDFEGMTNYILNTRNIQLDFDKGTIIFYNNQSMIIVKPRQIVYNFHTATLNFIINTETTFSASFTVFKNMMEEIVEEIHNAVFYRW